MILQLLLVLLSLSILALGAEGFVRGSASVASRFGIPPLAIGLTIVAYGTSAPELVVSTRLALAGQGDAAVGNVIGSNIFNIGVILGLTALLCPIRAQSRIIKIDTPIMIAVALVGWLLLRDGQLGRAEAALLLAGVAAFTLLNLLQSKRKAPNEIESEFEEGMPARLKSAYHDSTYILAGGVLLVLGSTLLVSSASSVASSLGVSQAIIALTVISAGTSAPELATSLMAAIRKQPDIAIGNIVGSNIFNILGILGTAGALAPLSIAELGAFDYAVMCGFSLLLLPLLWSGLILRRVEGIVLLIGYAAYLWKIWP